MFKPRKNVSQNQDFGITENGSLNLELFKSMIIAPDKFCIDWSEDLKMIVRMCLKPDDNITTIEVSNGLKAFKKVPMLVSILFLLVTFLVYVIVKKLRNLNGKCLMCHIATLIVVYASFLIGQYVEIEGYSNSICTHKCILCLITGK